MKRVKQLFCVLMVGISMMLTSNGYAQAVQGSENKSVTSKGDQNLSMPLQTTSASVPVVQERNSNTTKVVSENPMAKGTVKADNMQHLAKSSNGQASTVANQPAVRELNVSNGAQALSNDAGSLYQNLLSQYTALSKSEQDFATAMKMNVVLQALENMKNSTK